MNVYVLLTDQGADTMDVEGVFAELADAQAVPGEVLAPWKLMLPDVGVRAWDTHTEPARKWGAKQWWVIEEHELHGTAQR